jgi:hypothetical protein
MEKPLRKLQGSIAFSIVRREVTRVLGDAPSDADAECITTVVGETSQADAIYMQLFNSVAFRGLSMERRYVRCPRVECATSTGRYKSGHWPLIEHTTQDRSELVYHTVVSYGHLRYFPNLGDRRIVNEVNSTMVSFHRPKSARVGSLIGNTIVDTEAALPLPLSFMGSTIIPSPRINGDIR